MYTSVVLRSLRQLSTKRCSLGANESSLLVGSPPSSRLMSVRSMREQGKKSSGETGYVLLVIPAICVGLGVWQVRRREWKVGLIKDLEARSAASPVELPRGLEEVRELEYCRVRVRGEFDHSREVYIGPRQLMVAEEKRVGGLISSGSSSGAHVVTPLTLEDGRQILVNRGWVPQNRKQASSRKEAQINGTVDFMAVVRLTEKRQPFTPKDHQGGGMWFRRDVDQLADLLGTLPVFVDADAASTVQGGPVGGQTRVQLRNEHFSYILTWFSLAAATSWMWYSRYGRAVLR